MDKYNKSVQHQWFHHATWGDSKYKNEGIGEVLWHSLTEDGKVEVVNIKFGNKTYENVSVKHLNPTDESHHSHKRTGKELKKKKVKEGMIKLKEVLQESTFITPTGKTMKLGKLYTDKDKPPFKTEKQIEEEKLNEGLKKIKQKTRFGELGLRHGENPTAPGYDPEYVVDVTMSGKHLATIILMGDPRDKPYKAKVKVHQYEKNMKIKPWLS